jgi:hypothetical protein
MAQHSFWLLIEEPETGGGGRLVGRRAGNISFLAMFARDVDLAHTMGGLRRWIRTAGGGEKARAVRINTSLRRLLIVVRAAGRVGLADGLRFSPFFFALDWR